MNRYNKDFDKDNLVDYTFKGSISYLLGTVFIFSGVLKVFGIKSFGDEIAQYVDFYLNLSFFIEYRYFLAICFCLIEILVGVFSFTKVYDLLSSITMTLLLGLFVFLTGINYFYPAFGTGISSCGCFGDWIVISPGLSFVKSLLLLFLSSIRLFLCLKK